MNTRPDPRGNPAAPPLTVLALLLALAGLLTPALPAAAAAPQAPPLMLAKVYQPGAAVADYWVSEKLDGVRGYWDGQNLLTRSGARIAAPPWFTAGWPRTPMEGELWAGRARFAQTVSAVRQQTPDDAAWRTLRFMVFDLPAHAGPFNERLLVLGQMVGALGQPWVQAVAQNRLASPQALQTLLLSTVKAGGEGLMLHRGTALYTAQRSNDLLKLKTHQDAEARVVAHLPGKGKYAGQLGALLVELPAAAGAPGTPIRLRLGTGLSDAQRQSPPAIGSLVTYRYRGLTDNGVPRFASFMRVAEE